MRHLSRSELLEIMLEQSRQIEQLQAELEQARAELADRRIAVRECGSIAEASLRLNGVFEAAQRAADQYLQNVYRGDSRVSPPPRQQVRQGRHAGGDRWYPDAFGIDDDE